MGANINVLQYFGCYNFSGNYWITGLESNGTSSDI